MPTTPCPDCGREVSTLAASCPQCGRPFGKSLTLASVLGQAASRPKGIPSGDDIVLYEAGDIKVTPTRFIVESQTFAINNVTSVTAVEVPPRRARPMVAAVIGLLLICTTELVPAMIGAAILSVAAVILLISESTFLVLLRTAADEITALSTQRRDVADGVVDAINAAIVARG
jgi:hypothetical protein